MQLIKIDSAEATSYLDSLRQKNGIVALLGSGKCPDKFMLKYLLNG